MQTPNVWTFAKLGANYIFNQALKQPKSSSKPHTPAATMLMVLKL